MILRFVTVILLVCAGQIASAQQARLDVAQSQITDVAGGLSTTLYLSEGVPYRVFTLDNPPRLVVDMQGVNWGDGQAATMLRSGAALDARFVTVQSGWARLVVDLSGPFAIDYAEMQITQTDRTAVIRVLQEDMGAEVFAERSGPPPSVDAGALPAVPTTPPSDAFVVVIDPGHGGIDPGAQRAGLNEADLVLAFGQELALRLSDVSGVVPVLTRDEDRFVSLDARLSRARAVGADVFLSLHADALEVETAFGMSVYTLNPDTADVATQRMAERHERGDLLAGLDLSDQDDRIATVLMEMARTQTAPASDRLAAGLVAAFDVAGHRVNSQPLRQGQFVVLSAADFPSVLIELGFLSNTQDRQYLQDTEARARVIETLTTALIAWRDAMPDSSPRLVDD